LKPILALLMLAALASPTVSQCTYEVRDAKVTPEYGYLDFNYSARVCFSGTITDVSGKYQMILSVFDGDRLLRQERSLERRLNNQEIMNKQSEPFVFGPYNFQNDFGIEWTENASYEFKVLKLGTEVARSTHRGPVVQPPHLSSSPQFNANPYFFQDLVVSASFKDQPGLKISPSAHLELVGPLGDENVSHWSTGESVCTASGNSYNCQVSQSLSSFREGGDFTFTIAYNNLQVPILREGPFSFTVMSYSPTLERFEVPQPLDYTNFTIRAYVLDEGMKLVGGAPMGSEAELIITHPEKAPASYRSSRPRLEGDYVVFEWDNEVVPFNKSDVDLSNPSKGGHEFIARLIYHNNNWDYGINSEDVSFPVVEEIPSLDLRYDPVIYIRPGQVINEEIVATVTFSKGQGSMALELKGPGLDVSHESAGTALGDNRYRYQWQIPFDDSHIDHNYTLSLVFRHPALEGGNYPFEERAISVRTISIEYSNASVLPSSGLWNRSYTYGVMVDSSVDSDLLLQIYNPCSREWEDGYSKPLRSGQSILNWTIRPFRYQCPEMEGSNAMYRFKTSFAGVDYISRPYYGPMINESELKADNEPRLLFLDYDPLVYVREGSKTYQKVRAQVESPIGQGDLRLRIDGPEMQFEETSPGILMGDKRYSYSWSVPFGSENVGNHSVSLYLIHPDLKSGGYAFPEGEMGVILVPPGDTEETQLEEPQLVELNYGPLVLVEDDQISQQAIQAKVYSPMGQGALQLNLSGPDKLVVEESQGEDLGEGFHQYQWSIPFDRSNAGKIYKISLTYHLGRERYSFEDRLMTVALKDGQIPDIWEPSMILEYDRTLNVPQGGQTDQTIRATVNYSLGMGQLNLNISGPGMQFVDSKAGRLQNGQRYLYDWSIPFTSSHVGNSYSIALSYSHPSLPGGEYRFADRMMRVELDNNGPIPPPSQIKFSNPRVSPSQGSGITKYTYCVDIETDLQEADIQLAISMPNSQTFTPGNIVHYNGSNNTLCWPEITIDTNQGGNASYKFMSHANNSMAYIGPTIEPINVSGSVEPYLGVVQGSQIDDDFYSFTYTARITNISENQMPWIELMVRPPNSSWRTVGEKRQYDPVEGDVSWTMKPFENESYFGDAEFKFKIDGLETQTFRGPEIVAIYDGVSWIKSGTSIYSYRAWFNSTENLTIDLLYSEDAQRWSPANMPQYYKANSGRTIKTWPNQKAHKYFEFDININRDGEAK